MNNHFFNYNGKQIHYTYYLGNESNAIVLLVHGLGEHIGRYESWIARFKPYNYTFCAIDLPGHGLSDGKRGHIHNVQEFYDILNLFLDRIKDDFPNKPIIIYGHSMGGNIAANYVLNHSPAIKCLILSSPWIQLAITPGFFKFQLGKLMLKIYPQFHDKTNLDPTFISRLPEEVERYKNDPLVHSRITPSLFFPLFFNGLALIKKAKNIPCPTLVVHGTGDKLTSHKASEEFAAQSDKIDYIAYPNGYHELHHDACRDVLFNDILDWLSVHVVMR